MIHYKKPLVSIGILDFNRPQESQLLLNSLVQNAQFDHEVVYLSNGGNQNYVAEFYQQGLIDKLILNKRNNGCGLGTRQIFQSCESDYVIYVQSDQWLYHSIDTKFIEEIIGLLEKDKNLLYCDLAGNQGHGNYSERAHLINRHKYLSIPKINETIGGPGPWANYQWTENLVQNYMKSENLSFISSNYTYRFLDNGKWSYRSYPCGGETLHSTDEKILRIIKPLKQRYDDFPNLKLTDQEWQEVLSGAWPSEGKIPQADINHSFKVWD